MKGETDTVISILGFYLSFISILGSFFYIHLGIWFKQISTTDHKWRRVKFDPRKEKHIECYIETCDEKSWQPAIAFALLTFFMVVLGVFAERLRPMLPAQSTLGNYLYWPGYLFFGLYLIVSLAYLCKGYRKVRRLYGEIVRTLDAGQPEA